MFRIRYITALHSARQASRDCLCLHAKRVHVPPVHVQHAWTDAEENEVVETVHKHHSHIMGINLLQEDEAKQTAIKLKVRRRASDLPAPSAALVHVHALPFFLMVRGDSHRTT